MGRRELAILGIWLTTAFIWSVELAFYQYAEEATATVQRVPDNPIFSSGPAIEFRDRDGETQNKSLIVDFLDFRELEVGDRIAVNYLPKDPRYVRRTGIPWFSVILGVLFAFASFYTAFKKYRGPY